MLRSMTAFGRASVAHKLGQIVVEIQSVNRKHLEVHTSLPRQLFRFEVDVKKWVGVAVSRGRVSVSISFAFDGGSPVAVKANIPLVRQLKAAWDEVAAEIGAEPCYDLALLAATDGVIQTTEEFQDEELYREGIYETFEQALGQFVAMKEAEGAALSTDIAQRATILRELIGTIEQKAAGAPSKYRDKLKQALEEVLPGSVGNDERVLREICVYADRVDIAEEVTRVNSHLDQFEGILNGDDPAVGKTLEFVVQELGREINTIGAKSSDVTVGRVVVEAKGELERIREQLQNVE